MRSLVTGADGFIGGWLTRHLVERGDEVFSVTRKVADMRDRAALRAAVERARPERIFHLAALNHVATSFAQPEETIAVNVTGTIHLLDAARDVSPGATFVSIGTSSEYGDTTKKKEQVSEDDPLLPTNPYGISKAAQGMFARLAVRSHGLRTMHVRPFAIIGPGKRGDAMTQFAEQVVKIEKGEQKDMQVGNLSAVRDFVDVRDCVEALVLVAERGAPGESYNVCTGTGTEVSAVVKALQAAAKVPFQILVDPARFRPIDDLRIVGSPQKLLALGHSRRYELARTAGDTLAALRETLSRKET